jgi:hypothetical protein
MKMCRLSKMKVCTWCTGGMSAGKTPCHQ